MQLPRRQVLLFFSSVVGLNIGVLPHGPNQEGSLKLAVEIVEKDYTFIELLNSISRQTGLSMLSDGQPVRKSAKVAFKGNLREALIHFSDLFDMECDTSRDSVVLFRK